MEVFCSTSTIPSFSGVITDLLDQFKKTILHISIKELLGFDVFAGIKLPQLNAIIAPITLLFGYVFKVVESIFTPISFGALIDDVFPEFLGSIKFSDLLSFDIEKIMGLVSKSTDAIEELKSVGGIFKAAAISATDRWMGILALIPVYIAKVVERLKQVIDTYITITFAISGLVPPLPSLPSIPTDIESFFSLISTIVGQKIESLADAFIIDFSDITFLGVSLVNLPENILGGLKSQAIDATMRLTVLMAELPMIPLKIITDSIDKFKDLLGISFPTFCITIPSLPL